VQMHVYDDGMVGDDYTLNSVTKHNTPFTPSDAPPVKVKVTNEDKEIPRPISPPAHIEELNPNVVVVSPPLPSFIRRMENENVENPFRPQEPLYHEVDPIVEAYRQRPFPPSPSSSPQPAHNSSTVTTTTTSSHWFSRSSKQKNDTSFESSPAKADETPKKSSKSSTHKYTERQSSLSEARTDRGRRSSSPKPNDSLLSKGDSGNGGGTVTFIGVPPPEKAEIVHIDEKRKRCGCCSVQ